MKLNTTFYKLPLIFDGEQLKQELLQFTEQDWSSHPSEEGISSIILVSVGGTLNNDFAISGAVEPTSFLERCPYLQQVMRAIDAPISRSHLVKMAGMAQNPACSDYNYHWFRRNCIYIPIVTNPAVKLFSSTESIHIAAGEAWTFDNSQQHSIANATNEDCIHLVIETKKSFSFGSDRNSLNLPVWEVPYLPNSDAEINLEPYCFEVLTPQEICYLTAQILTDSENAQMSADEFAKLSERIQEFRIKWENTFSRFGHDRTGELTYQHLILRFQEQIAYLANKWLLESANGKKAIKVIASMLTTSNPTSAKKIGKHLLANRKQKAKLVDRDACYLVVENLERQPGFQHLSEFPKHSQLLDYFRSSSNLGEVWSKLSPELEIKTEGELTNRVQNLMQLDLLREDFQTPEFENPIFIVSAPRAGSTLLFETLCQFPDVWTIADESHEIIEGIPALHPAASKYSSNRLTEVDAPPHISSLVRERFARELLDRDKIPYLDISVKQRPQKLRFVEKTPKNSLRIPFLKTVFPGAKFIYLYRDPRENISSLIEGWRSRRFISYRQLPGWPFRDWSFLLPPGWSSLQDSSIAEIAAYQWKTANSYILEDLQTLPASSWCLVRYSDLVKEPKKVIAEISEFAGFSWDARIEERVSKSLPVARRTMSAPSPNKWRKNAREIAAVLPTLEPIVSFVER